MKKNKKQKLEEFGTNYNNIYRAVESEGMARCVVVVSKTEKYVNHYEYLHLEMKEKLYTIFGEFHFSSFLE